VIPEDVAGKPVTQYKLIGKSVQRLDIPDKVFARPSYLADVRMPDMVHARVVRASQPTAKLLAVDSKTASAMPGVIKVVKNGSFLAVVAQQENQARLAAAELAAACEWQA
jgi:nicotinate dehydrogenase subunit B